MKTAVISLLLGLLVYQSNAQPPKNSKTAQTKTAAAKPKTTAKQTDSAKPKPAAKKNDPPSNKPKQTASKTADKTKAAARKPATTAAKQNTTKPAPKPSAKNTTHPATTNDKPKPQVKKTSNTDAAASASKPKPKPVVKKPAETQDTAAAPKKDPVKKTASNSKLAKKPKIEVVEPPPVLDENEEFQKASTVADPNERIAALGKFVETFPLTEKKMQIAELITRARGEMAVARQQAGDGEAAFAIFTQAASEAPKPIPDQLYADFFAKLPTTLYFSDQRQKAFDIAKILEERSEMSAPQLLNLAAFYLSIENGTDARRLAEKAVQVDPNSSPAYQTLGLANRMNFMLDESAAAFTKALELDPTSMSARRGLAEMKRSLGKADEALALYKEILAKDAESVNARNGLILSLFEANKRSEAESEMSASLAANPNNVVLLAGAAYWYAAHGEGDKAVEYGNKAIAVEPRYIWAHVALARGQMLQKRPVDAERTLLAARRYGNFPTLEYEIASARLMAGFYRDAADELLKHFSAKSGSVSVDLGLRIPKESKHIGELIGYERRASIFAPTAADNPDLANQLASLLEITLELESKTPDTAALTAAVDTFVKGDDNMKVHRQIYAASQLLDKKTALPKVIELTKAASGNADASLDSPNAAGAVMASELYESRTIAMARGEFIKVPEVPKPTLSAIIRGRIEEINGWGHYEMDNPNEAVLHLRRAASVMPNDSAWWRSSVWRLGSALVKAGKEAEGLDEYIRCYRLSSPDRWRYETIENLYKKVKGNTDGLEARIGPKPAPPLVADTVAQNLETVSPPLLKPEPTPTPSPSPAKSAFIPRTENTIPSTVPIKEIVKPAATPTPEIKAEPSPTPEKRSEPTPELKAEPTPTPVPEIKVDPTPVPTREIKAAASPASAQTSPAEPKADAKLNIANKEPERPTPTPTPEPKKQETDTVEQLAESAPPANALAKVIPGQENSANIAKKPEPGPEQKRTLSVIESDPYPRPTPTPAQQEINPMAGGPVKPLAQPTAEKNNGSATTLKEMFPPVVISIPESKNGKSDTVADQPKKTADTEKSSDDSAKSEAPRARVVDKPASAAITPCTLTATDDNLTLQHSGGNVAILIGVQGANDISAVTVRTSSPADLEVKPGPEIAGIKDRALYVIQSLSAKLGIFQVVFELPCGKKEVLVKVK